MILDAFYFFYKNNNDIHTCIIRFFIIMCEICIFLLFSIFYKAIALLWSQHRCVLIKRFKKERKSIWYDWSIRQGLFIAHIRLQQNFFAAYLVPPDKGICKKILNSPAIPNEGKQSYHLLYNSKCPFVPPSATFWGWHDFLHSHSDKYLNSFVKIPLTNTFIYNYLIRVSIGSTFYTFRRTRPC